MSELEVDQALAHVGDGDRAGRHRGAGLPREPRRRCARVDARPLPRAPCGRAERGGVVPAAVPRCRALPRAARPRSADCARRLSGGARRDGHVRLRLARASRRPRAFGQGGPRAHRARPPRVQHLLRHDQRHRSGRRGERRAGAPARAGARAPAHPGRRRLRSTPRSCATPVASSTTRPHPACSIWPASW